MRKEHSETLSNKVYSYIYPNEERVSECFYLTYKKYIEWLLLLIRMENKVQIIYQLLTII